MNRSYESLLRAWTHLAVQLSTPRRRDERGDVPGWVLITVVTVCRVTGRSRPRTD